MAAPQGSSVFDAMIDEGRLDAIDAKLLAELVERLIGSGGDNPIGALIELGRKAGLDGEVRSWIGPGQPLPLQTDGIRRLVTAGDLLADAWLDEVATRVNIDRSQVERRFSTLIPSLVKTMTPRGEVPSSRVVLLGLESLRRRAVK
jgi:uncharacterized protein YidB (DUF937 family)